MKVVVTGASGFIGAHVVPLLLARGVEVVALGRNVLDTPSVRAVRCDILKGDDFTPLMREIGPSHLLHLGWNATPGAFWNATDNIDWVASSLRLFRAFAEVGGTRWVGAGTCAEYDWTGEGLLNENSTLMRPLTLYGAAKHSLGEITLAGALRLGLSAAWGRIFWLYGPNEKRGRLVSDLASALAEGRTFDTSAGLQKRDFMHVEDVAAALVAVLFSDYSGPVNIATGEAIEIRRIVSTVAEAMEREELVRFGAKPTNPSDPAVLYGANDILSARVGFKPSIDLFDGLRAIARNARA